MTTKVPARLTLDLSRLQLDIAKSNDERVSLAAESLSERRRGTEYQDLSGRMQHDPDFDLIRKMHEHCNGILEDTNFFKTTTVPKYHENDAILEVYSLFHKVKETMDPQDLVRLKDLTEKVAEEIFRFPFKDVSPELQQSVPTPNSSGRSTHTPPLVRRNAISELTITLNNQELSDIQSSTT